MTDSPVTLPTPMTYLRGVLRRLPGLVAVWAAFGVVLGVCLAPAPTVIGVISGVLAGLIVYIPVGGLVAAVGGRWDESLIGGAVGFLAAVGLVAVGAQSAATQLVAVGLTFGGLFGGTCVTALYRVPRLVLGRVRALAAGSADRAGQSAPA